MARQWRSAITLFDLVGGKSQRLMGKRTMREACLLYNTLHKDQS